MKDALKIKTHYSLHVRRFCLKIILRKVTEGSTAIQLKEGRSFGELRFSRQTEPPNFLMPFVPLLGPGHVTVRQDRSKAGGLLNFIVSVNSISTSMMEMGSKMRCVRLKKKAAHEAKKFREARNRATLADFKKKLYHWHSTSKESKQVLKQLIHQEQKNSPARGSIYCAHYSASAHRAMDAQLIEGLASTAEPDARRVVRERIIEEERRTAEHEMHLAKPDRAHYHNIWKILNHNFESAIIPGRDSTVDETMLPWNGFHPMIVYIEGKPEPVGWKAVTMTFPSCLFSFSNAADSQSCLFLVYGLNYLYHEWSH
ncbi:hypothetical protein PROFUN_04689 [Planoprotostelium fungivorum]|uniref:PiggyBac transposable element-derived protein domain-containing protein n=1 Tax=Planoprotostelium fungivorum TaxID=1890364 RepID=A0A2P6NFT1_9EUKA|nr:hypothetical protein PROFUN_04689 [Planoprotostelium fungivorum]